MMSLIALVSRARKDSIIQITRRALHIGVLLAVLVCQRASGQSLET